MPIRLDEIPADTQRAVRLDSLPGPEPVRLDDLTVQEAQELNPHASNDPMKAFGKALVRSTLNIGKSVVGTAETAYKYNLNPLAAALNMAGVGAAEKLGDVKANIQVAEDKWRMETDTKLEWAADLIGSLIPQLAASFVAGGAGAVAGGAKAGLAAAAAVGFAVEGDNAYEEAKERGATEAQAQGERVVVGTINAAIEALQVGRLLKFKQAGKHTLRNFTRMARQHAWKAMKGEAKNFGKDVLKSAIENSIEEFVQEGVQIGAGGLIEGKEGLPQKADGSTDWWAVATRMGGAALAGAVGGAAVGVGSTLGGLKGFAAPNQKTFDAAAERIRNSNMSEHQKARWLQSLNNLAEQSGILKESAAPETPAAPAAEVPAAAEEGVKQAIRVYVPNESGEMSFEGQNFAVDADASQVMASELDDENLEMALVELPDKTIVARMDAAETGTGSGTRALEQLKRRASNTGKPIELDVAVDNERAIRLYARQGFVETGRIGDRIVMRYTPDAALAAPGESATQTGVETGVEGDTEIGPEPSITPGYLSARDRQVLDLTKRIENDLQDMELSREEEAKAIKEGRAKRFEEVRNLLSEVEDPQEAAILATAAMKGELKVQFEPLSNRYTREEMDSLYDMVRRDTTLSDADKLSLFNMINMVFNKGQLAFKSDIKLFDKTFGTNIQKIMEEKTPHSKKAWKNIVDAMNLPRAVMASMDFSGAMRQGWMLAFVSPKDWAKGVAAGYRAMFNQEYAEFHDMQMRTDDLFPLYQKFGGETSSLEGGAAGEEVFISQFANKIPGVAQSQRSFVTALNTMRFYTFKRMYQAWAGTGKTSQDYRNLCKFLNHATGKGDWKWLEKHLPEMNLIFFAPRLQVGRIQTITDVVTMNGPMRKIIAANLAEAFGTGLLALGLLSLIKGVKVETNPASSDWGKVRYKNTRIDFWGGYQQIMRFMFQMVSGKYKSTATGREGEADRASTFWRFLQGKLSPGLSISMDVVTGHTFEGERTRWRDPDFVAGYVAQHATPLFLQDCRDALKYQGWDALALVAPLASHGIGAATYEQKESDRARDLKDYYAKTIFNGAKWDDLGPEAQKALRENRPDIGLAETKAKIERQNYVVESKMLEESRRSASKLRKSVPSSIRRELNRLAVDVPGLGRHVSNGWYLTPERYKLYEQTTIEHLNKLLSFVTNMPGYNDYSDEVRKALLEEAVKYARTAARQKIVDQVNMQDIERLR